MRKSLILSLAMCLTALCAMAQTRNLPCKKIAILQNFGYLTDLIPLKKGDPVPQNPGQGIYC